MRRVFLLALVLPLVAGCGAQKGGALDDASSAMADAGSSRVEMTVTAGEKTLFTAAGVFDYERDRGKLVMQAESETEDFDPFGDELEVRFIGRTIYSGWMLKGKMRWTKEEGYDPEDAVEALVPVPGGTNPDRVLGLLLKSSKEVEVLGKDDVRGVAAKHYRAHLDEKKLGDSATDYAPAGKERDVIVDAWIDGEGLVRRLRMPDYGEGPGAITFDFFDFGVKVDVEPPPAAEVITEDELDRIIGGDVVEGELKTGTGVTTTP
ncbi:MAG TPA: hypothetical protein VGQ68_01265 [Gaiellaceae bacterium]|jgi:hypothetical protein|nr:hypothetical protein [Gaiellaceae bacterium]